jgi:hypothetical protein
LVNNKNLQFAIQATRGLSHKLPLSTFMYLAKDLSEALAAWSGGIVSACVDIGREIESLQGIGWSILVI